MKVLTLLSLAAAVTALPIHAVRFLRASSSFIWVIFGAHNRESTPLLRAFKESTLTIKQNIKVVRIDSEGNANVQNFPNVDLDNYKNLNELASAAEQNAIKSDVPIKELSEQSHDVPIKELSNQSHEDFIETFLKKSYEAFNKVFGSTVSPETLPKPHSVQNIPKKIKSCGGQGKKARLHKAFGDRKLTKEDIEKFAKAHGLSGHKLEKFYEAHGIEQTPEVAPEVSATESSAISSHVESVKQFSQDLYQDVRSIDYKESFNQIAQDPKAVCAVGSGIFGGISLLVFLTLLFSTIRRIKAAKAARRLRLEDDKEAALPSYEDSEEETLMSEKQ